MGGNLLRGSIRGEEGFWVNRSNRIRVEGRLGWLDNIRVWWGIRNSIRCGG